MIHLTQRDLQIVNFLKDQGFATYDDLRLRFFGKKSIASRRLSILRKNGIIKSQNIYDVFGIDKNTQYFPFLVQLKISPKHRIFTLGESMLRSLNFGKSMQKKNMVFHQLFLNHIFYFLEKAFPDGTFITEQMVNALSISQPGRKREIAPDLTVDCVCNGQKLKIAVELERTIKDRNRYLQKSDYFDRSIYTHIWYISLTEKSLKILQKQMLARRKYGFSHMGSLNRVLSPELGVLSFVAWINNQGLHSVDGANNQMSFRSRLEELRQDAYEKG